MRIYYSVIAPLVSYHVLKRVLLHVASRKNAYNAFCYITFSTLATGFGMRFFKIIFSVWWFLLFFFYWQIFTHISSAFQIEILQIFKFQLQIFDIIGILILKTLIFQRFFVRIKFFEQFSYDILKFSNVTFG